MSTEVFLSLQTEQSLLLGERILFAISSLLNIVALFCLIRKTPAHQAEIRSYLLFIQATVIATDVYFGVLFEPFPVLQAFAGYCVGVLCRYLQPTLVVFIYGAMIGAMGASINMCTIHRHQKIVARGRFIMGKGGRTVIKILLLLGFCVAFVVFAVFPFDQSESDRLIDESSPDVKWMKDRGAYYMLKRSLLTFLITASILMLLSSAILVPTVLFAHMFIALHREKNKSAKLKRTIRTSLIRLFIQINIPNLFIVVPMIVLVLEVMFDCLTFDLCLFASSVIPFHPIVHNLILLTIVPEYRAHFARLLSCGLRGHAKASNTIDIAVVIRTRAMSCPMI